jgi:hypothetical protein
MHMRELPKIGGSFIFFKVTLSLTVGFKKKGHESFPNENLVLSICQVCNCLLDNTYQIIFKNVIEF